MIVKSLLFLVNLLSTYLAIAKQVQRIMIGDKIGPSFVRQHAADCGVFDHTYPTASLAYDLHRRFRQPHQLILRRTHAELLLQFLYQTRLHQQGKRIVNSGTTDGQRG